MKRTTEQQFLPLEAQQQQQQAGSSPCAVMMPQPAAAGAAPPLALQGGRLVAWQPQQFCAFACLHSLFSRFASNHFDCNCERACAQPALSGHKWRAQPWCVLLAGEPLSCVLRVGCYRGLACCLLSSSLLWGDGKPPFSAASALGIVYQQAQPLPRARRGGSREAERAPAALCCSPARVPAQSVGAVVLDVNACHRRLTVHSRS